ncbi:MAG: c-type cytochrome biogenesis protein CcmI [Burkholderiales bacterium]
MIGFYAWAGLLIVLAMVGLLYPLLRREPGETALARGRINARVYNDQLAELEVDRANGIIDPAAYAEARHELERRALLDIDEDEPNPVRATRWPAIVLVLIVPFAAILTYVALGKPAAMLDQSKEHAITVEKIQGMVANLAARMEKNPDDLKGWVMLGRAYKAMDRIPEAIQAFERAGAALDEDPQNLIDFAEALARGDRETFKKRGAPLIARALKADPDHIPALVFAGSAAFEEGDFRAASRHWNKVLGRLPPDSDEAKAITEAISRADNNVAAKGVGSKDPEKNSKITAQSQNKPANVAGSVALDPTLAARAGPDDTVFIFARAAEGPRAPLAVMRAKVRDLPLKFSLDDSQAMSPELRISRFDKIRVEARISKSGNATPQSGDLQGASDIVAAGKLDVRVVIDKPVP